MKRRPLMGAGGGRISWMRRGESVQAGGRAPGGRAPGRTSGMKNAKGIICVYAFVAACVSGRFIVSGERQRHGGTRGSREGVGGSHAAEAARGASEQEVDVWHDGNVGQLSAQLIRAEPWPPPRGNLQASTPHFCTPHHEPRGAGRLRESRVAEFARVARVARPWPCIISRIAHL